MRHASSQIVGLIEMEEGVAPQDLVSRMRPHARREFGQSQRVVANTDTQYIQANLEQINADLRVELARFIVRTCV